jgi:hypothetical protein
VNTAYELPVSAFGGLARSLGFGHWRLCAGRSQIHIAVESPDGSPVETKVNHAGGVLPSDANFKPFTMPLYFPFEGEGGVRGCFAVVHAK